MPLSLDQFAQQLSDSRLLPADDVAALRSQSPAADAEQFARELVKQKKLTAYQAQQIYSGKAKSLVLGNYVILDKLGQGGMGMVLKARHRRMERLVAIKVLSPTIAKNAEATQRFQREVKAAAKLEHPNIVTAHDADEASGTHFLVMQYVDGSDFSSLVKSKGPLPVEQAVSCIVQAARGLEYAHKRGVIHRDIKPANLLLDTDGVVKILDMGLARIEDDTGSQAELTGTGQVMGTVDYMAPEQARNTKAADARSDIYSLGITLWYLLVGKAAYDGQTLTERLLAHQTDPIPSLCTARPGVPATLDAVFQKMVAKKPADRYQSITEVLAALESVQRATVAAAATAPSPSVTPSEDSQFNEFLAGLAHTEMNPRSTKPQKTAVATATAAGVTDDLQPTLTAASPEAQTNVSRPALSADTVKPARATRAQRTSWQDRRVQIGGGVGAALLLGVIVITITSRDGTKTTVTVPGDAKAVDVAQDGKSLVKVETQPASPAAGAPSATKPVLNSDLPTSPADLPAGFVPLLNGRDLAGWKGEVGDPKKRAQMTPEQLAQARLQADEKMRAHWRVENGVLFFDGKGDNLCTVEDYADFELYLEWKISAGGDSGIYLRGSPQVQIQDPSRSKPGKTPGSGGLYNNRVHASSPLVTADKLIGEWNAMFIRMVGEKVTVSLNGQLVVDNVVYENYVDPEKPIYPRGPIELQKYSSPLEFRNLLIREIGSVSAWHGWPADAPKPAIAPFDEKQAEKHQEEWAAYLKVPVEYTNSIGMKFRLIPPGEFLMGGTPAEIAEALESANNKQWQDLLRSEAPLHKVILTEAFYLAVNEITQKEYLAIMGTNPSNFSSTGDGGAAVAGLDTLSHPVERVSWNDAIAFCVKLGEREKLKSGAMNATKPNEGNGYRLPTEAEWEFACRAGTTGRFWHGDDENALVQNAWFERNSGQHTHPVGQLMPNPYGLFDMHGNVWNWVQDGWTLNYYEQFAQQPAINPTGPSPSGSERIVRGGSRRDAASGCRSSNRGLNQLSGGYPSIGIRVCLDADAVRELLTNASVSSIDLLARIDPQQDRVSGEWERKGAEVVGRNEGFAVIEAPYRVPEEYDLTVEFTRHEVQGQVAVALTHAGKYFKWTLGNGPDADQFGFDAIGGKYVQSFPGAKDPELAMVSDRRYVTKVEVRRDRVIGYLDGKKLTELPTDYSNLSVGDFAKLRDNGLVGLIVANGAATYHRMELEEVTGKGTPTRAVATLPPAAAPPTTLVISPDDEWTHPENLGALVNSEAAELHPHLSFDGLTLLFTSDRTGGEGDADLWTSTRKSLKEFFGAPVNLGPNVNSPAAENGPCLSRDGLVLWFGSNRVGGRSQLWESRRKAIDQPFGIPTLLAGPVNADGSVIGPDVSSDGLTLMFESTRSGGLGRFDLWMASRRAPTEPFGLPVNLGPTVNSSASNEGGPVLSADGLTLIFHSSRPGGKGEHDDLWAMTRTNVDAPWSNPVRLGGFFNSAGFESHPTLSGDSDTLIFASDRVGSAGPWDLWMSRRVLKPKFGTLPAQEAGPR